ncbi:heparan-alpha-glucosaminide N-acetyltransferase domain-containing protein [Mycetocola sp. 2940]|uniref:heparan-alpha-glucosaminide N-acetyltransferase domain-containing protein n=1 Tax=Mycetocola sp. 2940 TaxID=3156452 RepID=UPI00339330DB
MDIARGLAILGMFIAHAMPRADEGELLVDGRSSILFATLAGVSLGLLSGGTQPPEPGSRSAVRRVVVVRALFVFLLGVLLWTLGSEIAIILDYYAVMFLLVLPLLFAGRAVILVTAAVVLVAAPALARLVDPGSREPASVLDVLREYLLTGYYPALVWLPLLLVGLVAARSGLERRRTQAWLVGAGCAAAIAGYGSALILPGVTAEAHSGSTPEILGSGGTAFAILGLLLIATTTGRFGRGAPGRALAPRGRRSVGSHRLHGPNSRSRDGRWRAGHRGSRLSRLAAPDRARRCLAARGESVAVLPRAWAARAPAHQAGGEALTFLRRIRLPRRPGSPSRRAPARGGRTPAACCRPASHE